MASDQFVTIRISESARQSIESIRRRLVLRGTEIVPVELLEAGTETTPTVSFVVDLAVTALEAMLPEEQKE